LTKFGSTASAPGLVDVPSITLKIKFANFRQITRSRTGQVSIAARSELEQLSNALLEPLFPVAKGIRLLGISLSSLATADVERQRAAGSPVGDGASSSLAESESEVWTSTY
jgi:hypothetical protein